ncbi:MAG: hypothetical protein ACNA8W_00650 [Bradymonadaceae bacterium]
MNGSIRRVFLVGLSLMLLAATGTACNDDSGAHHVADPIRIEPGDTPPIPSVDVPEELLLSIVGEDTLAGEVGSILTISVALTTSETLEGLGEETIEFEIVDSQDGQGHVLASRQVLTNADGQAQNEVQLGTDVGTLTVRATHERAGFVEWTLDVLPLAVADLKVSLVYERPEIMTLQDIDVRLYRSQHMDCSMFLPFGTQAAPLNEATLATVSRTALFQELDTRDHFTLTAVARGDRGQTAASGCLEGIELDSQGLNEADILLELIPLIATGRYDVLSYWDLTNVLAESGPVGSSIVTLFDYFENPGQALYNTLLDQIEQYLGPDETLMLRLALGAFGLDTLIQDTINGYIDSNDVLSQIRQAGLDLRDTVSKLQVDSILTIGKASHDDELYGEDDWFGLTYYWRRGCDIQADPDCGQFRIGVGPDSDLGIAGSDWEGRVVNYDWLQIDDHMMSLNYGRIIIHILNNVILPGMTDGNAHSLTEAFAYWIGCDSIAQSLSGTIGIPVATVEAMCLTTVSTVFGFIELVVNGLDYPLDLYISGHGYLINEGGGAQVDLIEDGVFVGYVERNDGSGSSTPADATWTGVRLPPEAP